ncbi:MAG TPA: SDR family oxidoreductase, partial [Kofleriaceae bacterium]|nr:SDR family oxidoreductase [Kofleriaceae bacterium]
MGRRDHAAEIARQADRWRDSGAEMIYVRADVAEPDQAARAVAEARRRFGRLDGVFHLAGVVRDSLFFRKDPAEVAQVLAPKLPGAVNLDRATAGDALDLFVLFSSLSAAIPNLGQSDYAYANAALDSFAAWRRAARPGVTVSIAWPYWAEGGMQVPAAELARTQATLGLAPMPTAAALAALEPALSCGEAQVVMTYGAPSALAGLLSETAPPPLDGAEPALRSEPGDRLRSIASATQSTVGRDLPARDLPANDLRAPPAAQVGVEDIAIIGAACRFPQADDLPTFWRNLAAGHDAVTEVPGDRWRHDDIYDPTRGKPGKTYGRRGAFLSHIDRFAPSFFSISRRDAERMDPQERLFLQTAWRALEDAGHTPESLVDEHVGVFAAVMWSHYQLLQEDGVAPTALHSSVANRVSYALGLSGPSLAVDTACSSSLVALHLALESLRAGDATMALVGGVNLMVHPQKYLQLAADQFLSDDGLCRAFGRGGTGYVPGEGCGVLVLKPLARALASGDHIEAIIKSSAVNHGGRTSGYTVPDPASQGALIREAIRRAGVPSSTITYIEAHGTGTSLGDPIELEGLRRAFDDAGLPRGAIAVGSVKSNIGHLESAAGMAGLMKVLLQMRHRTLVPSLHAEDLNPNIDFAASPFHVQRALAPWRASGARPLRAGVSAFGAGGTNAHIILESPPSRADDDEPARAPELVLLSAPEPALLRELASALAEVLAAQLAGQSAGQATSTPDDPTTSALGVAVAAHLGLAARDLDPDATL